MWKFVFCIVLLIHLANSKENSGADNPEAKDASKPNKDEPIVTTSLGPMKGYTLKTREKRMVAAFTSIPYAIPPVKELRFMAPLPLEGWDGTLDATKTTPACVGRNPYTRDPNVVGQEDCLYLNVYVPYDILYTKKDPTPLPVMMFIHGGGLMCGDSSTEMYGPQYLLDRDIVLVTTNYRLGPLGFLSTMDEHCPGNNGLKDQQLALKWIQQHIQNFSGDPNRVTIFGESAGASSVHFHMLSNSSRGLFHRAISESGTALVPWAAPFPGDALHHAILLAKFLECPAAPSQKMLDCLRTKEPYDIIATDVKFYSWDFEPMTPFKAVLEPEGPGAFLTREPKDAIRDTDVPWLTGLNKDEGLLKSIWITMNDTLLEEYISGFDAIAPITFYYENSILSEEITEKIKKFYNLYDKKDQLRVDNGITRAYSDAYFNYPMVEAVELTLRSRLNKPVYLYQLNYEASNSFSTIFGDPSNGNHGVSHADELMHLFPIPFLVSPISSADVAVSQTMITLWTNFATTGNPNLPKRLPFTWKPATDVKNMQYLKLDFKSAMDAKIAERSKFWGELPIWHNTPDHKRNARSDEL